MNYSTMEYEMEMLDGWTSGNILGGVPQWIFLTDNVAAYAMVDGLPARVCAEELGSDTTNLAVNANIVIVHYDENSIRSESKPVRLAIDPSNPTFLRTDFSSRVTDSSFNNVSDFKVVFTSNHKTEYFNLANDRGSKPRKSLPCVSAPA